MITPAEFKTKFPEFDSVDDTLVQQYIDEGTLMTNVGCWGVKATIGLGYLVAHTLALDLRTSSGPSGMATSEKVGDLSKTYAGVASNMGEWSATPYGLTYYRMLRSLQCSPRVL